MEKKRIVLVGNGMAGVNVIEQLLKLTGDDTFDITIFGEEHHPNYNRILLSSVLAGDADLDSIVLHDWEWYRSHGIRLYTGHRVTQINARQQTVTSDQGVTVPYDELILATGSIPFILPIPGADKKGVIAFRSIADCRYMMDAARHCRKAVVIGGGLLGLEAARGLLNLGMDVSVVHLMEHLMERQLDPTASRMLEAELRKQGMKFLLSKKTKRILGDERVTGVQFDDGTSVEADLVVMAVGIRPNVELAKSTGLTVNRGIVVDDLLRTSDPHIHAVGECAEHRGIVYGLVAPLYEQGHVLAKKLAGVPSEPYQGSVVATQLKVSGVNVFSAGEFMDAPDTQCFKIHDEAKVVYKKAVFRDGKAVGGILFGDTGEQTELFRLIREGASPEEVKRLFLGEDRSSDRGMDFASMPDDTLICGCNGVSKGAIAKAVREKGLNTVDEVKACTGASRSCGGCRPMVQRLLAHLLGREEEKEQPICACTTLGREEVVQAIREKGLKHVREVMHVLGWNNTEGCSKCRPALLYYISMVHPDSYEEDAASRFVNERLHANIQHDGTYSVVPRMYGGVTSPEELRRIADVAEKYQVKMVKLTGGQRIDLLGVKKEDLPRIWEELGMPSGYAYSKAIRTVKTCVGNRFCRFGTQDSIGMGIRLEKYLERLYTPAKVKMAVSACPRNCAESGIKDIGIVGVEGGWEIYVGGNGGVRLRAADLLCKVKTEDEVVEMSGAFLQYYRENARYGERTSEWVARVGLESFKRAVVEDRENRLRLLERLNQALAPLKDPWQDIVRDQTKQETMFGTIEVQHV